MEKVHFNPGDNIKLLEDGAQSIPGLRKMLKAFDLKYGIDYDTAFMLKHDHFIQCKADDLLVLYKGQNVSVEVLLKK